MQRFSLQALLVLIGLRCILLAVSFHMPGYIFEASIVAVGLYLIHQAWHTRFKNWEGAIVVGILICLIGMASTVFDPSLRGLAEGNEALRKMKEELIQDPPQLPCSELKVQTT